MALNIKDPETDRLVRDLAKETGETVTHAVRTAVRERLDRTRAARRKKSRLDELNEIALRCAGLPVLDNRTPDEILGYDEHGLPT